MIGKISYTSNMENFKSYLGNLLVARTSDGKGLAGVGVCVTYCDAPTVTIRQPDGSFVHWRADMCQVIPLEREVMDRICPEMVNTDGK